jgi:hypothetical protein
MLTPGLGRFLLSPLLCLMTLATATLAPRTLLAATVAPLTDPALTESADPLDSPYPAPWAWITETQATYAAKKQSGLQYYRTPALLSPDGCYAAYSRIEVRAQPNSWESKVLSVMFLENLATGELQVIRAQSPIAQYLERAGEDSAEMEGVISVLLPASWSPEGDKLLARQLEGALNSSDISDYGVVWHPQEKRAETLSALSEDDGDMSATLLGWNQQAPEEVLFRASVLGEEENLWVSVHPQGGASQTAMETTPQTYGRLLSRSWTGAQSIR